MTIRKVLRWNAVMSAGVVLMSACGTTPPVTPNATPDASTDPGASAAGTAPASAPGERAFGESSIVHVIADELRLRAEPGTAAALVSTMPRGHVARIRSGPVEEGGFRWWELIDVAGTTGWAADGDGTDSWLATGAAEAEPLLRLHYGCDVTGPVRAPVTTILGDGTVILAEAAVTPRDPGPPTWLTGTLSPAGVDHIRQELLGSPYLRESGEYVPEPLPGAEPLGHGACVYEFSVGEDDVVVTAVGWFGDEEEAAFWKPSPERKMLTAFAKSLIELDDVLADPMWARPPTLPYLGARYTVVTGQSPASEPLPSGTPRLGDDPLVGLGHPDAETQIGSCWEVDIATAFDVATALAGADPPLPFHGMGGTAYALESTHVVVTVVPQTPVGEPSCADIAS